MPRRRKRLWRFKRGAEAASLVFFRGTVRTEASIPLVAVRRPCDTPIWKLEVALKCRSCRKGRYAPQVHMIKLTERREITPYKWVHPDEDR
jgi:hypothetical protein